MKNEIHQNFIHTLRQHIPKHLSFIDEIAETLSLNYDAAYRRAIGRVQLNIDEVVVLAKKYNISLNDLFKIGNENSFIVTTTNDIISLDNFNIYLNNIHTEMSFLKNNTEAHVLFASREFPMFYFFTNPILMKFKFYLWYNILNITPSNRNICYKDFALTDMLIKNAQKVGIMYQNINITEIWSFGALNNILQQLIYFSKMHLIEFDDTEQICNGLKDELHKIEDRIITKSNIQYKLFFNEIIMNNNAMIMNFKGALKFAYPYTLLKFFIINDQKACLDQETYIKNQLEYCTDLNNANILERHRFFANKYQKINQCLQVIKNENDKPFFL